MVEEKLRQAINAWEQMAPAKNFGMTLAEFKTGVQPSFDIRDKLTDLADQTTKAINDRGTFDEASLESVQRVLNSILADPTEGSDSSLVEGFGYVRKSERKTGLTRKKAAADGKPKSQ
jgi:hypothetical protein